MARKLILAVSLFTIILTAGAAPVLAQEGGGAEPSGGRHWLWIAAGFSMAIASGLCGLAQGKAAAAACEGIARNPGAAGAIRTSMIIGLALIESLALYVFVIIFVKIT
ncbi:MAG: ATP synthase F0 subunit C [Acidobacteriota bacterium]